MNNVEQQLHDGTDIHVAMEISAGILETHAHDIISECTSDLYCALKVGAQALREVIWMTKYNRLPARVRADRERK